MSSGRLERTRDTEEYEDDFEDVGEASKAPEEDTESHGSKQRQGGGSASIIAEEIAAELAPAGQAVARSISRDAAQVAAPSGPALIKAVINSRCKDVATLLRHGAPVRFTDAHGWTPLHWACSQGYPDVIEAILRHVKEGATGEDGSIMSSLVSTQDTLTGWTPLHVACVQEHPAAVKLLLAAGADVNVVDKQGDKPVDCIKSGDSDAAKEIVRLLSGGEEEKAGTNTGK